MDEAIIKTLHVMREVGHERQRQDEKWGEQNHHLVAWHLILAEEFGEVGKALNEWFFRQKPGSLNEARAELIQTAAVCIAMVECMDRNRSSYDC